ncbi:MAG: hypothetical protein N4A74_25790 [Carboxylicivirga sp.]|jgi:UDP-N-acetylmuramyl pentapeptide phosphotransferase/UDP-N-acetylglucosamine-1-phosphate transferase|nr:hypothetical protein [Carboxylicivirga sp.]
MKLIDKTTKWFINQSASRIFGLSLLGLPLIVWLFSIIYQLEPRTNKNSRQIKLGIASLISAYTILYTLWAFGMFFQSNGINIIDTLKPYHFGAMFCSFIMIIIASFSYVNFEKQKGKRTYNPVVVVFFFIYYIIGIWFIQPNLNDYAKNTSTKKPS